jgi:hypothetical protein
MILRRRSLFLMAALLTTPATVRAFAAPHPFFAAGDVTRILNAPQQITKLYARRRREFQAVLGAAFATLDDESLKFAFAGILAYHLKPYGKSSAVTLVQLVRSPALKCDSYAMLTVRLFRLLQVQIKLSAAFVGWDGDAVGNHVQLFVTGGSFGILVDPTVGIVAKTTFDDVARGAPVPQSSLADFYFRPDIAAFHARVRSALLNGDFRPHNILYYYTSVEAFVTGEKYENYWPTPQHAASGPVTNLSDLPAPHAMQEGHSSCPGTMMGH